MPLDFLAGQATVLAVTIAAFVLTLMLALVMTRKFLLKKQKSHLYWSLGLWCFAIGVFLEILFAAGIYSEFLIEAYLFLVVVLVEFLAMGSMELVKSKRLRHIYFAFVVTATLFSAYTLQVSYIGNILISYVVQGNPPLLVIISSSIATFAATLVLAIVAIKSYLATKSNKMLSIIAGVIIVSIAGTLYIVEFPAFLYLAEFVGILLLWFGFI